MGRVLVIDVGGTSVKLGIGGNELQGFESSKKLSASEMCARVLQQVPATSFDVVTIGYPGPINSQAEILAEPQMLGAGWLGFDFAQVLGKPTRLVNDAVLQAVGAYQGGRMLFLGLGTGLGTCFIADYSVIPLEIADLPFKNGMSYGDHLAKRGLERLGQEEWIKSIEEVIPLFKAAFVAEEIVFGGGNVNWLTNLPPGCRRGDNVHALVGGTRLWENPTRFKLT